MFRERLAHDLSFYNYYHSKMSNKILHYVGVPLMVFSFMILLSWIHIKVPNVFDTTLSWLAITLVLIYYFFLDVIFAATLMVVFILMNLLAYYFAHQGPTWVSFEIFLATFIIGLACQIAGHLLERKRPALTKSACQVLIAPMYLVAEIYFALGYKTKLKHRVDALTNEIGER